MGEIIVGIIIFFIVVGVLAIVLKICARFPYVNFTLLFASSLALVIFSFSYAAKTKSDVTFDWIPIFVQGCMITCYIMFLSADFCFDRQAYWETTATYHEFSDTITYNTRLVEKSLFWSTLGGAALIGFLIPFIAQNVTMSKGATQFVGVIGIIFLVYWSIRFALFLIKYIRVKKGL